MPARFFMKPKKMVLEEKKKDVVYEIPCQDWDNACVGEAGWTFKKHELGLWAQPQEIL